MTNLKRIFNSYKGRTIWDGRLNFSNFSVDYKSTTVYFICILFPEFLQIIRCLYWFNTYLWLTLDNSITFLKTLPFVKVFNNSCSNKNHFCFATSIAGYLPYHTLASEYIQKNLFKLFQYIHLTFTKVKLLMLCNDFLPPLLPH